MQKKKMRFANRGIAFMISCALFLGCIPFSAAETAKAATTELTRADSSIVYFVDAGDYVTNTVCSGDQLGTRNSVTDKVYGVDAQSGYKWGVVDTVSTPLKNNTSGKGGVDTDNTWAYESNAANADVDDKTSSNRYTKNQYEAGIAVRYMDYKFEVNAGTYQVETYTVDPWSCSKTPTLLINSADATADFSAGKGTVMAADTVTKQTVTMSAAGDLTVSYRASGDANKAINVCYIKIVDMSKLPVQTAGPTAGPTAAPTAVPTVNNAKLDADAIYFPSEYVTGKLNLPASGAKGSTIAWETSKAAFLAADGTVTRPQAGAADQAVVLKATVTNGTQKVTRQFMFTVLAENSIKEVQQFDLDDVEITDGYYFQAQKSDIEFLKKFDNDRLLSRFRETAGLDTKGKTPYGGWENSLIGGHSLGHYLTAVAQAVKATGDAELKTKLDDLITGLKECQDKLGTGFIFGAQIQDKTNVEKQFDALEGKASTSTWVPWYTTHKIMAGLVDVYKLTGNEDARTVASKFGDWIYNRVNTWTSSIQGRVLGTEYGGMNDCLYDLYSITGSSKHRDAAHKFDETNLYATITSGKANTLNGRHANTNIPKFVGALKRYQVLTEKNEAVEADAAYLEYAKKFFDLAVDKYGYINGGLSVMEHFRAENAQNATRTQATNESCCAYNMLKLARELYRVTGEKKYADYYENTLRNSIMGAIRQETGATTYFSPMATGYFKFFGTSDPATNMFWCCTGSGMEDFTKLGDSIYFYKGNSLVVNQYIASKVKWEAGKMKITQESDVTKSDVAKFKFEMLEGSSQEATIYLRVPEWISGTAVVKVNGTVINNAVVSNGYIAVKRTWSGSDELTIQYPMAVKAYGLPDNSTVYGFKYGPTVLAAKLGTARMTGSTATVGAGVNLSAARWKVVGSKENDDKSVAYGSVVTTALGSEFLSIQDDVSVKEFMDNINSYLVKDTSANIPTFKLNMTDAEDNITGGLTFVPYNTLNDERYGIYWYFNSSSEGETPEKILADKKAGRLANSMIDSVQPGYSQYETDSLHQMTESNSVAGTITDGGSTRLANAGGYFMYNFKVNKEKLNSILCRFAKEDNGKTIKVTVGDTVIGEKTLNYSGSDSFYDEYFAIPADVLSKNSKTIKVDGEDKVVVQVKFQSASSTQASARLVGGLYMTGNFNNNASITSVTCEGGTTVQAGDKFTVYVPTTTTSAKLKFNIADSFGLLYINDVLVNDAKSQSFVLDADSTNVTTKVYAEDHNTSKDYAVTVVKGDAPVVATPTPAAPTVAPTVAPTPTPDNRLNDALVQFDKTSVTTSTTVYKGSTKKVTVSYSDEFNKALASNVLSIKSITYATSNKKVASVSSTGVIKGVKKGSAKITTTITTSTDKTITRVTSVTVKNPEIKISGNTSVKKGKTITLKAKLYGLKGKVSWSVNNKKIAKISSTGKLKGLKKGSVSVTAKVKTVKKTIKIKVK